MTNKLRNEKLIQFTNELSLTDLEFILRVWQDRISIWNPNTRQQDEIHDIWINGTAVELGIRAQQPNDLDIEAASKTKKH